ncbi:hypothetical protein [Gordonia soli]|uniref:Uncharacterized protein n=1 Tax=Gordonia soli NBRC 108243 TaxID=1223545 RepID=M0QQ34_9ACTN|nr:hypothetical protein [Gordonia soli]GAC70800.1 hypothetical protein GS4_41_00470 [Gordonia soli NBRC 108243]
MSFGTVWYRGTHAPEHAPAARSDYPRSVTGEVSTEGAKYAVVHHDGGIREIPHTNVLFIDYPNTEENPDA